MLILAMIAILSLWIFVLLMVFVGLMVELKISPKGA